MSQARNFADLLASGTTITSDKLDDNAIHGNRNLIINGAMQVAQRGTSTSFAHDGTNFGYIVDRFEFTISGNHETFDCTVSQDSDAPDGFSNSLKVTTGTAESNIESDEYVFLRQRIEGQNLQHLKYGTSAAVSTTVSFYVKSSVTGTFGISMYSADGDRNIGTTYTINSANTWEYKTVTFAGDISGTINNDNGDALNVIWHLASGSDFISTDNTSWGAYSGGRWAYGHAQNSVVTTASATFQITGVQLEVGEQATPFEHRSYGDELIRCQRYYEKSYNQANAPATLTDAGAIARQIDDGNLQRDGFDFQITKRASPTVTIYNPATGSTGSIRTNSSVNYSVGGVFAVGENRAFTDYAPALGQYLTFHFTADAEL